MKRALAGLVVITAIAAAGAWLHRNRVGKLALAASEKQSLHDALNGNYPVPAPSGEETNDINGQLPDNLKFTKQQQPVPPDACEPIRAAIAALGPKGGLVTLPAGVYECGSTLAVKRSNVALRGAGKNATILRLADHAQAPLLIIGDPKTIRGPDGRAVTASRVTNVKVSNLAADGNRSHQDVDKECEDHACGPEDELTMRDNAITVRGASFITIENVEASNAVSGGLILERDSDHVHVRGFESHGNYFDGLAATQTTQCFLQDLDLWGNRDAGLSFDMGFYDNHIADSKLHDNGDVGVFARDARGNLFENIEISNSGNHGVFLGAVRWPAGCPMDNEFRSVTIRNSKGSGIYLGDDCAGNRVTERSVLSSNGGDCFHAAPGAHLAVDPSVRCLP